MLLTGALVQPGLLSHYTAAEVTTIDADMMRASSIVRGCGQRGLTALLPLPEV
jgi:hypothetical protein